MRVYKTDPLADPRWEELQQRHPKASIFHTRAWLETLRRTYGYQPVAFTTSPPELELTDGLPFCQINTWLTRRRVVSLPFSDHCSPLVSGPETLECLLAFAQQDLAYTHSQYIEVRPLESQLYRVAGFGMAKTYTLHNLDLRPGLDKLFCGFHKECVQRKIRRAEREALNYEEGGSEALLNKFYYLLLLTRRRQGLPPQPVQWFRNLITCLGDSAKIHIASTSECPVAGALTLRHRDTMVYKYGCSDHNFSNLGGTQLVIWKVIQEATNMRFSKLDMGRSDNDNPGLMTFKDRWGADRSTLTYWNYPARYSTGRQWTTRVAKRAVAHAPDNVLTTVGKLLYKHIG